MKKERLADHLRGQAVEFFEIIRMRLPNAIRATVPEDLHQARVASRRLRETLRMLELIHPRPAPIASFRKKIVLLTRIMGPPREIDVVRWYLNSTESPIPPKARAESRALLGENMDRKARSARRSLRTNIHQEKLALPPLGPAGMPPAGRDSLLARHMVEIRLGKVRSRFANIRGREDVRRLHLLRISMKKLRYSTEILLPFLPKSVKKEWNRIKEIQSVLGRLHDDHVTGEILGRAAGKMGKGGLVRVAGTLRALRLDYRRQWRRFAHLRMPRS